MCTFDVIILDGIYYNIDSSCDLKSLKIHKKRVQWYGFIHPIEGYIAILRGYSTPLKWHSENTGYKLADKTAGSRNSSPLP